MAVILDDVFTAVSYTVIAGVLGFIFLVVSVVAIPKIMYALTPKIDEEKEIVRGNLAVAKYYGAVIQAIIIGISIIIGAAIIAGIHG